jgi:enoyl-CoA hydratase/carnithine racemase
MDDRKVILEKDGRVAVITLNSPVTSNAMDLELGASLTEALEAASGDVDIKAVVMTGRGRAFSAGANVKAMRAELDGDPSLTPGRVLERFVRAFAKAAGLVFTMEKPVVAAVNGAAAGGGLALAMAGDMAVADPRAKFDPAFVRLGLVPVGGLSMILPAVMGRKKAAEFLYLARAVNAEEALALGLINRIAEEGKSVDEALELAHAIADKPGLGIARTKRLLLKTSGVDVVELMDTESRLLGECGDHPEHRKMMEALLSRL